MCRQIVRCYVFILTLLDISLNTKLSAQGNSHGVTVQQTLIEGVTFQEWESSERGSAESAVLGLVATPPALSLGRVPLAEPRAATVTLTNTGNATLHLASLAGTTHHFHASFFTAKTVPPQGNASFSVVYLGRQEGLVAAHLYIHTSLGVHKYPVSAVGVASSWGVWPLVGVRVPENATVHSTLSLYNPTDHVVQVSEIYSSASWLTLELPEGGASAPRALWAIPPHSDRALVKLRLDPPAHHHPLTAYIRIKGNMTGGGALVVGVEASRASVGTHLRPLQLRLGTRGDGDPPYTVQIEAATSAEGEGEEDAETGVWGARCSPQPRDPADDTPPPIHAHKHAANGGGWSRGVSVSPVHSRPALRRTLAPAATLTLHYETLWAERERGAGDAGSGEAYCAGWAVVGGAALPYSVRLVSGTVRALPADMHWVMERTARDEARDLRVRNEFATDVRVCDVQYPQELDKHFQIETLTPLVVGAGGEATVARVRLRGEGADLGGGGLRAQVTLRTNITGYSVQVPIYLYSGKLNIEWEWPRGVRSGGSLWLGALRPGALVSVRARVRHAGPARACSVRLYTDVPHAHFELDKCRRVPHAHDEHPCRCVGPGEEAWAVLVVRAGVSGGSRGVAVARWGCVTSVSHVSLVALSGSVRAELVPHAQHAAAPYSWWSADVVVHNGLPRALRVIDLAHDHHKALNFTWLVAGRISAGGAGVAGVLRYAPELLCRPRCYTGLDLQANEGVAWVRRGRTGGERALRGDVALVRQRLAQFGGASREPLVATLRTTLGHLGVRGTLAAGWPRLCAGPASAPPAPPGVAAPLLLTVRNPSRSHPLLLQPALGPPLSLPPLAGGIESSFCKSEECVWSVDAFEVAEWRARRGEVRRWEGDGGGGGGGTAPDGERPPLPVLLLDPGAEIDIKINFVPPEANAYTTYLYLRNNLTVVEGVQVTGRGARPAFELGGRRPGAAHPLLFEVEQCDNEGSTVVRSVSLRNTGAVGVRVREWRVGGRACEGRGFRVDPCAPLALQPNATRALRLAFTADWTVARAVATLRILSDAGPADFRLSGVAPAHLRASCARVQTPPPWSRALRTAGLAVALVAAALAVVAAPLDADRLLRRARSARPLAPPVDRAPLDLRAAAAANSTLAPAPAAISTAVLPPRRRKPPRRPPLPLDPVAERRAFERWRADVLRVDNEHTPDDDTEPSGEDTPDPEETDPSPLADPSSGPHESIEDAASSGTESPVSQGDDRADDDDADEEEEEEEEDGDPSPAAAPHDGESRSSSLADSDAQAPRPTENEGVRYPERSVETAPSTEEPECRARAAGVTPAVRRDRPTRRRDRPTPLPLRLSTAPEPRPAPPPAPSLRRGTTWSSVVAAKGTPTPESLGPIGSSVRRVGDPPPAPAVALAPSAADHSLFYFNGDTELSWRAPAAPVPVVPPPHYTAASEEGQVGGVGTVGYGSVWGDAWTWDVAEPVRPPPGFTTPPPPLRPFDPFRSLAAIWAPAAPPAPPARDEQH